MKITNDKFNFVFLGVTNSTNEVAKNISFDEKKSLVISAMEQTGGRGRLGRDFFSPKGGLYFSYVFKNKFSETELPLITGIASVILRRAIISFFNIDTKIKWVNDLYYGNKKIAGILTELYEDRIIIGMGINVFKTNVPAHLNDKIGFLSPDDYNREILDAFFEMIINELIDAFDVTDLSSSRYIDEYRKNFLYDMGTALEICRVGSSNFIGTLNHINTDFTLDIKMENGNIITLNSGEISISKSVFL